MRIAPAYYNLTQAAQYLGIGLATAQREWPGWEKFGVIPSRFPKRTLRFKKDDLDKIMDCLKLVKE